ncbi:hypothetical protein ES332_A10G150600v1 [Gossypium tomentosum]|uniref:Uncharacterized protein n=1 Tax=Gossypium tomentosum TaxID=34277 RepID=A0A5D2NQV9_GOSTO|nr:hypothetical protein ES332_A10G150600v1 [Gossypium tomentosum]
MELYHPKIQRFVFFFLLKPKYVLLYSPTREQKVNPPLQAAIENPFSSRRGEPFHMPSLRPQSVDNVFEQSSKSHHQEQS